MPSAPLVWRRLRLRCRAGVTFIAAAADSMFSGWLLRRASGAAAAAVDVWRVCVVDAGAEAVELAPTDPHMRPAGGINKHTHTHTQVRLVHIMLGIIKLVLSLYNT